MTYYYYVSESISQGKGFITHEDNELAHITGYPGSVFVTENTTWATRIGATEVTKEEAQVLVDAAVSSSLTTTNLTLPVLTTITLP
jgi:uncharacterized membrane protein YdcZ (DUF606 family)